MFDCVVEEGCVLGYDSDAFAEGFELDITNVLAVDCDAAGLDIVEAEEEAEDGGFSAAGGADDGDFLACWNGEIEVLEDRSVWTVAEGDFFEFDFAAFVEEERWSICGLFDGYVDLLEVEECFHVQEGLAKLAVDTAKEVERDGQLEDKLIDHDEIADCEASRCHALSSHIHHACEGSRENQVLAAVEVSERSSDFDASILVVLQSAIVAFGFVSFVVEVLDCLIVDQAVHCDCSSLVIRGICLLSEFGTPSSGRDREPGVSSHCAHSQSCKFPAIVVCQNARYQADLECRGNNVTDHAREEKADTLSTSVNCASQATGLSRQMKVEIEFQ